MPPSDLELLVHGVFRATDGVVGRWKLFLAASLLSCRRRWLAVHVRVGGSVGWLYTVGLFPGCTKMMCS